MVFFENVHLESISPFRFWIQRLPFSYMLGPWRSTYWGCAVSRVAYGHLKLLLDGAWFLPLYGFVPQLASLKSNYIFSNVSPVLYEKVVLKSAEQCTWTLGMLTRRVDVARHVRKLIISLSKGFISGIDNATASSAVRKVAGAMHLESLAKFCWDAEESSYDEDMWFALRMGCVFPSVFTLWPSLTCLLQVSSITLYRNVHRLNSP